MNGTDSGWAADVDDWAWSDPIPDGARHAMPDDDGIVPCCGSRHESLPHGDWMTAGAAGVTSTGSEA